MYTGKSSLVGIKFSFADKSKIISVEEHQKSSNLFKSNFKELSSKYPNIDIETYTNDFLILLGTKQPFKTKYTPDSFLEIKLDEFERENYVNDKTVQNSFSNFMKWGSDSNLRKIMEELFCGSVDKMYAKLFNESIKSSNNSKITPEELNVRGLIFSQNNQETPLEEYSKYPKEIVLMVLNFYNDFLTTFLGKDFVLLSDPEGRKKINYYNLMKFLKESYLPHKDNKMMEEIFALLPNGRFYMNMIKSICELEMFKNFENTEISKLMDY